MNEEKIEKLEERVDNLELKVERLQIELRDIQPKKQTGSVGLGMPQRLGPLKP